MTLPWRRIGRTSPLHVAHAPGMDARVERGEGGRWVGTLTVRVEAGDDAKARAKVEAMAARIGDADSA
jgi:hypothetical protein